MTGRRISQSGLPANLVLAHCLTKLPNVAFVVNRQQLLFVLATDISGQDGLEGCLCLSCMHWLMALV